MTGCSYITSIHLLRINPDGSCTYKITIFTIIPSYLFPLICDINFNNFSIEAPIKIKHDRNIHSIIKFNIIFYLYFSSEELKLILNLKVGEFLTLNTLNIQNIKNGVFPIPPKESNYSITVFATYDANVEKRKRLKIPII